MNHLSELAKLINQCDFELLAETPVLGLLVNQLGIIICTLDNIISFAWCCSRVGLFMNNIHLQPQILAKTACQR